MPIDFTQLYQRPSANSSQATDLAKIRASVALPLKPGEAARAEVTSVRTLTAKETSALQAPQGSRGSNGQEGTLGRAPSGGSSEAFNATQRLVQALSPAATKDLAQDPKIRLATLAIAQTTLSVLTRESVKAGDSLWVQRMPGGRLATAITPSQLPLQNASTSQSDTPLANHQALGQRALASAAPNALAQQVLREAMPYKNLPSLESAAAFIKAALQVTSSVSPKNSALYKNLTANLTQLEKQSLTIDKMASRTASDIALQVKSGLQNSGTLFEQKLSHLLGTRSSIQETLLNDRKGLLLSLNNLLTKQASGGQLPNATSGSSGAGLKLDSPLIQQLVARIVGVAAAQSPAESPELFNPLPANPRGDLLATKLAAHTAKNPATGKALPTHTGDITQLTQQMPSMTQALLNAASAKLSAREASILQTQILLLTHQLTLSNLGRIRTRQVLSEPTTAKVSEGTGQMPHLQFDLPIKHGQDFQLVQLTITQQEQPSTNNERELQKSWIVQLQLLTEDAGEIHFRVQYLHEKMDVTLWSDDASVLHDARNKAQTFGETLAGLGVSVEQFQCLQGAPASKDNHLKYNLVDINT